MKYILFWDNILMFFTLLIISELVRWRLKRKTHLYTAVGSIIMAIGIFTLSVFHETILFNILVSKIITLELLILWLYAVAIFVTLHLKKHFLDLLQNTNNQLGIGTWVAGAAILDTLFLNRLPSWHLVIWVLTVFSLGIWIVYIFSVFNNRKCIFFKDTVHTGNILLTTVSTQAVVLLLNSLTANGIPYFINFNLINLGIIFYTIGLVTILIYSRSKRFKHLILGWSNYNSIIHGALSITGLASLRTGSFHQGFIMFIWVSASCVFLLVEGISLLRLYYRIYFAGFSKGALLYDVSQWSRNFTYGMYYSFTLSISNNLLISNVIIKNVITYGQYVVLIMLLLEIFLYFRDKLI